MRIISKFRDYYDGVAGMGMDKSIVYLRETRHEPYIVLHKYNNWSGYPEYFPFRKKGIGGTEDMMITEFYIIGFCGKTYVGLMGHFDSRKYEYAYYGDEILNLKWRKSKYRWDSHIENMTELVKKFHDKENDELFFKYKSPIFAIPINKFKCGEEVVYVNPNLNEYKFFRVKESYLAFQEIQMYISGVLGSSENKMVEVSDKTKILKYGFDLKYSFRKDSQK